MKEKLILENLIKEKAELNDSLKLRQQLNEINPLPSEYNLVKIQEIVSNIQLLDKIIENINKIIDEKKYKSFKCISCNVEIKLLTDDETSTPESDMWNGGFIGCINAGYGSRLDGSMFYIAICDKCANQKAIDGTLVWQGDYMSKNIKEFIPLKNK